MAGNGREPLNRLSEYAKTAEQMGLRSFLVTETPATDALAAAQHIASITSRICVGTGIVNIYTRHPSLLAGHAIAIDALAPGRLLLGLGTSHKPVNDAYGINMNKPVTAMRDCVTALRKAFRGEPIINRPGFNPPKAEGKISIYIAGISPKSIELLRMPRRGRGAEVGEKDAGDVRGGAVLQSALRSPGIRQRG
jgi:alkanesulfonate monooxygenase SsuD/methylene tetrahydromethanopterin reductase-like flavin-dependent oxidoreductase (luciferase family)